MKSNLDYQKTEKTKNTYNQRYFQGFVTDRKRTVWYGLEYSLTNILNSGPFYLKPSKR